MEEAKPAPSARAVCAAVVDEWKAVHCPRANLEIETRMATARVPSWISPRSVLAGVGDIFCTTRVDGRPLASEAVEDLANRLAHRLSDEGLLVAQPRRAGLLHAQQGQSGS